MPARPFRPLCVLLAAVLTPLMLAGPELEAAEPQLSHMVYFSLKQDSPAARDRLVAGCRKYLSGHEGTLYFAAGKRAADMVRDVNDQAFDVSLMVVFRDKAAHDKYAKHPRHLKFIEVYSKDWAKVRVFDSILDVSQGGSQTATEPALRVRVVNKTANRDPSRLRQEDE